MALMRNFTWLAVGEAASRVIALAIVLYLARIVGAQNFGLLGSALALVTYFAAFVAGGVGYKGVREVARAPAEAATLVRIHTAAHLVCLAVVYAVLGACLLLTPIAPQGAVSLVLVYSLTMVGVALGPGWALRGIEDMRAVAIGEILQQLAYAALLVAFVRDADTPLEYIAGAQIASELLKVAYGYAVLRRHRLAPARPLDWGKVFATVRGTLLITLGRVPRMLYLYGDVLLLAWLATAAAAGEFLASHRLVLTFVTVGTLVRASTFPTASQLAPVTPVAAGRVQMTALRNEWLVFAPAWVLCGVYAQPLVHLLYGAEYVEAAAILRWMLPTVPVVGLSLALQDLLAVVHRDRTYTVANTLAMLLHAGVAWALIGGHGALGAAYAALGAEIAGALLLYAWRERPLLPARLVGGPLRVLAAAGTMFAVMELLAAAPIWINVPIGAAVFGAAALALRAVTLAELRGMVAQMRSLVGARWGRT